MAELVLSEVHIDAELPPPLPLPQLPPPPPLPQLPRRCPRCRCELGFATRAYDSATAARRDGRAGAAAGQLGWGRRRGGMRAAKSAARKAGCSRAGSCPQSRNDHSAAEDSVWSRQRKRSGKRLGIGPDMIILIGAAAPTGNMQKLCSNSTRTLYAPTRDLAVIEKWRKSAGTCATQ